MQIGFFDPDENFFSPASYICEGERAWQPADIEGDSNENSR